MASPVSLSKTDSYKYVSWQEGSISPTAVKRIDLINGIQAVRLVPRSVAERLIFIKPQKPSTTPPEPKLQKQDEARRGWAKRSFSQGDLLAALEEHQKNKQA